MSPNFYRTNSSKKRTAGGGFSRPQGRQMGVAIVFFYLVSSIRALSPRPSCLHSAFSLVNSDFFRQGGASSPSGVTMGAFWRESGGASGRLWGRFGGAFFTKPSSNASSTAALSRTCAEARTSEEHF